MKTARVTAPGHTIELIQYVSPASATSNTPLWQSGAMHLAFQVEDIDKVVAALTTAGVVTINPVQTMLEGPRARVRAAYVRDADGVVLEFIEITRHEAAPAGDAAHEGAGHATR